MRGGFRLKYGYFFIFLGFVFLSQNGFADSMQAHAFNRRGPWFEGWYTRITDIKNKISMAVITTSAIHQNQISDGLPPGYVAVVVQSADSERAKSFEVFPQKTSLKNVGSDFLWQANGFGFANKSTVEIVIPMQARLRIETLSRKPWSASRDDGGPEGLLTGLTFIPLHWFVYNTAGAGHYQVDYFQDGKAIHLEGEGFVHQEKNWGQGFPTSWIWLQAIGDEGQSSLALAGGDLTVAGLNLHSYSVGYRSKNRVVDFNVSQGFLTKFSDQIDSCARQFTLEAKNAQYKLKLTATAAPTSFAELSVPTLTGYDPGQAIESFRANIKTELFLATGSLFKPTYKLIETKVFDNAALEFGAKAITCGFDTRWGLESK